MARGPRKDASKEAGAEGAKDSTKEVANSGSKDSNESADSNSKHPKDHQEDFIPKKTCLGDSATMKRMLDDAAIKVLLDESELGYEEDTALSNVKLIVGFTGVAASLVSHVYPLSFPKNWWVLFACCAGYFICAGILQLLLSFVELESILVTRATKDASGKSTPGFTLSSHFPRYQEIYTLGITPLPKGSLALISLPKYEPSEERKVGGPPSFGPPGFGEQHWDVTKFFDDEGIFYEEKFCDELRSFFKAYESSVSKKQS